jgi:hypothetical protein
MRRSEIEDFLGKFDSTWWLAEEKKEGMIELLVVCKGKGWIGLHYSVGMHLRTDGGTSCLAAPLIFGVFAVFFALFCAPFLCNLLIFRYGFKSL